jgi:hypothetical protein
MKTFLKHQGRTSPKLRKAVISNLGEIETLLDVANHGANGGFGKFCYYSDTTAFFKKNKKDILSLAQQDASDFGETVSGMISRFKCLELDSHIVDAVLMGYDKDAGYQQQVYNAMAWYALESVAQDYQSFKEEA